MKNLDYDPVERAFCMCNSELRAARHQVELPHQGARHSESGVKPSLITRAPSLSCMPGLSDFGAFIAS